MFNRIAHSISLAIVIVVAFGAGVVFGQFEGIRGGIAQATMAFDLEGDIRLPLTLQQEMFLTNIQSNTEDDGACPLWMYGEDPPAVGFYYHPTNGRLGVLYVSVPDMRYFIKTFEGCELVQYGYLE